MNLNVNPFPGIARFEYGFITGKIMPYADALVRVVPELKELMAILSDNAEQWKPSDVI
jgi:hypothetical protein